VEAACLVVSCTLVAITLTLCALAMDAGAVYSPELLTDPTTRFNVQETEVLPSPVTVAVNCWVWETVSDTLVGLTEIGERRLTVDDILLVASAALVAVTTTVRWLPRIGGAVYSPAVLMDPMAGLMDQTTPVLVLLFTWAENCWDCPAFRFAVDGPMDMVNGLRLTCAETVLLGSAPLVAITLTMVAEGTALGAVYSPEGLTEPTPAGLVDHTTVVFVDFWMEAVNCRVCPP
jgi:hypothetical protein